MMVEKIRKQDGITIVAVVAVVIVLLILVGVTISQITGTSSIMETSKTATSAYKENSFAEKVKLKIANLKIEKAGKVTLQDIIELKNSDSEITDVYKSRNNVILVMDNYQCIIDENLEINSIEEYKEPSKTQLKQVKRKISYCTFDREEN